MCLTCGQTDTQQPIRSLNAEDIPLPSYETARYYIPEVQRITYRKIIVRINAVATS